MERCVGGAAETDADAACGRDDDATMTESEAAAPIGLTSCRDVETADKLIGPDWHHISGPFDVHLRDGKSPVNVFLSKFSIGRSGLKFRFHRKSISSRVAVQGFALQGVVGLRRFAMKCEFEPRSTDRKF